ncbi:MAG TPA: 1-acyl-sn-glycerol-3-phosphate acyltransferase [Gemmatimonadaceae bacterium]|nr:1-acyl-sn-glycerol-3-phosphate acyltransferase [Gemmatimonadaceae bacterium]
MPGFLDRLGRRALLHNRARIDRFKLASRAHVRARLLADERIAEAVAAHAAENRISEHDAWRTVEHYVQEIVPFFNVVAYYQIGYRVSGWLLNLFYKVSVDFAEPKARERLPRDAVIVYVMNHRSNADYVLVSYALAGQVAISYAVGEWARAFPLEHVFKAFGSYFIRRRYREPLYHTVLERYVQLITREGVTQGIFVEGGLTRDGKLRPPKIGLLDYVLGIGRDEPYASRLHIVPVAVNYDRVLEDRSLLRELESKEGRRRPSRVVQAWEVAHYVGWNVARLVTRQWKRYGRAAVVVGAPIPLGEWFASQRDLFTLEKPERLARVQSLCDGLLERVGALIPVTPVPLACAAIQSFDGDFIPRDRLLERIDEMRSVLRELNAGVLRQDRTAEELFDRAYRMLRMRRVVARTGSGYLVLPRGRPLVSYYANSIAHLLGGFAESVRARDALPAMAGLSPLATESASDRPRAVADRPSAR